MRPLCEHGFTGAISHHALALGLPWYCLPMMSRFESSARCDHISSNTYGSIATACSVRFFHPTVRLSRIVDDGSFMSRLDIYDGSSAFYVQRVHIYTPYIHAACSIYNSSSTLFVENI